MDFIGHRIKLARKRKGYNQTELADRIGVTQPTIGNWESSHHQPRQMVLTRIADTLDVPRAWLISGNEMPLPGRSDVSTMSIDTDPYLSTPILHVPVLPWPQDATHFFTHPPHPIRYVTAALRALQPFAMVSSDPAITHDFPDGTVVIFDATRGRLQDGKFYLFNWEGNAILRRWRAEPCRLEASAEPAMFETLYPVGQPIVLARAVMSIRDLQDN